MSICNCFEEALEGAKKHLVSKLPEGATEFSADWKGGVFFFSGDHVPVNPAVSYEYRAVKKDGTPAKNLTKNSLTLLASHCPYCGRKLEDNLS